MKHEIYTGIVANLKLSVKSEIINRKELKAVTKKETTYKERNGKVNKRKALSETVKFC